MKDIVYKDGSIIKKNGSYYVLRYIKGYGWKAFKIKDVKKNDIK